MEEQQIEMEEQHNDDENVITWGGLLKTCEGYEDRLETLGENLNQLQYGMYEYQKKMETCLMSRMRY